jgi:L-fucose isomerase-like protein
LSSEFCIFFKEQEMAKQFQAAYIPIGVPTFHRESAEAQFRESINLIASITEDCVFPEAALFTLPDLRAFLDAVEPDLIILQNVTFANAAYTTEILNRFNCPLLLWTLREPVADGGRLRLNSLTGAYSAGNALRAFGRNHFEYIFGGPAEAETRERLGAAIRAARLKTELRSLRLATIGHTPPGFGFGRALDSEMSAVFGVSLEAPEIRELIEKAKNYTDEEGRACLHNIEKEMKGLEEIPEKNLLDFARLYKAYLDYTAENNIGALASRCWPDFFTAYGTPVCSVLALLNDRGIAAACEADSYGALSLYIGMRLSGEPCFFGDPASMDETENTITFWHCGMAACSLAHPATGACVGLHPNRKIGPVMNFGCRPSEKATVFRVGRLPNGSFRFFIMNGEIPDKPKQFTGASLGVKVRNRAKEIVSRSVRDGWEPHFVVIYGDVTLELEALGNMLGLEICRY